MARLREDPDEPVGDRGDQLVEGNLNDDEAQLIMKLTLENVQDHPGWTQDQVESEIICKAKRAAAEEVLRHDRSCWHSA